jgi:hypothetical protein
MMGWAMLGLGVVFGVLSIWLILGGYYVLSPIINQFQSFITQKDFLIAFWSSVFSAILIAFMIAIFVNYFTPLFRHPELVLVVKQGGFYNDKLKITQRPDGDYEASFMLAIKNIGSKTLKASEGYWHVYFPNTDKIETLAGAQDFIAQGESNHLRDLINLPIYPKSFSDFGPEYKFIIKKDAVKKAAIYYFLATDYGYFPKTVKLDQKTGFVAFFDMGSIALEWPK